MRTAKARADSIDGAVVELAPVIDDEHTTAKHLNIVHIVRGEQHCHFLFHVDGQQKFAHARLRNHVEADGWKVTMAWPPPDAKAPPPISVEMESEHFNWQLLRTTNTTGGKEMPIVVSERDQKARAFNVWLQWSAPLISSSHRRRERSSPASCNAEQLHQKG